MPSDDVVSHARETLDPRSPLDPADAVRAIECDAKAIYVSNHGGRSVDHELSTAEALEDVVIAVDGRGEVAVDGGFTRGPDVVKALAPGARVVAIGRLPCWGLALGGDRPNVSPLYNIFYISGGEDAVQKSADWR